MLKTERLVLRPFEEADAEGLHAYLGDEEVVRYEPYGAMTMEECRLEAARRASDEAFWAVCLADGTLIGNLYLSGADEFGTREIGYVFARACWHKGYATEAARRLMAYAFERLATRRIIALCDTRNAASFALMERLGMRREGEFKKNVGFKTDAHGNTIWTDSYQYAILKEEFEN
ncbi:MAG: GNAT family N-acetyltransferase [Eubacteriales bacterium]|nr:GNAT family N-acetyltransferase [Eubacteriales bacterium]